MPFDKLQLQQFIDNLIGFRAVGVANDEELAEPISPEMRSFIVARIGELTPHNGYQCLHRISERRALSGLLREIADSLDACRP